MMTAFLIICASILAMIVYFVFGFWTMLIESNHQSEFKTLHRLIVENKMSKDADISKFINNLDIMVLLFWLPFLLIDSVRYVKFELDNNNL